MPFGPVNPDDLDGDELDAWYRRSPADIEQARQAGAQQAYNDFFYGGGGSASDDDPSRDSSLRVPAYGGGRAGPTAYGLQQVSYTDPASQIGAAVATCPSCHGRVPPPPLVFPAWSFFRDSLGNGGGPSKPPPPDRKQCEIQQQRDGEICARQPTVRANAVCRGTAMDRYAHCGATGQVDTPRLYTVPGYGR